MRNAREAALFQPRRARVQPFGAQKTREMGVAPVAAGDENIHKTATFPMRHPMPGGGAGCALYTGGVFLYNRRERKRRMRHAQGLAAAAAHLPACEPVRPGAGGAARLFRHGHLHDHLLRGRKRRRSAGCGGGARARAGGAVVGNGRKQRNLRPQPRRRRGGCHRRGHGVHPPLRRGDGRAHGRLSGHYPLPGFAPVGFTTGDYRVPSETELAAALALVDFEQLELSPGRGAAAGGSAGGSRRAGQGGRPETRPSPCCASTAFPRRCSTWAATCRRWGARQTARRGAWA